MLSYSQKYWDSDGVVEWKGVEVASAPDFEEFLQSTVRKRFDANEEESDFQDIIQEIGASVLNPENLKEHLDNYELPTDDRSWKIGEAVAECLLIDCEEILLPWNRSLDETNPNASLPGTDIIGFTEVDGEIRFFFAEVKTSWSKSSTPVTAMYDLRDQIRNHLNDEQRRRLHNKILRYLHPRVKRDPEYWNAFKNALKNHVLSKGMAISVSGILLRDTSPTEKDVKSPTSDLAMDAKNPTKVSVAAYYLPVSIKDWPDKMRDKSN